MPLPSTQFSDTCAHASSWLCTRCHLPKGWPMPGGTCNPHTPRAASWVAGSSVVTDTHVDLPQIFLWYHCLQLVKYFLLVPMSFCTAHTLGLKTKAAVLARRSACHPPPHPSHPMSPPGSLERSRYGEDTVISVSLGVHSGPRDPDFHHPSQKYPPEFKNCQSICHTVTSLHLNILL